MLKLAVLQPEIGLSNDEVTILVYTSLSHGHLTNMIVLAGEFLKWFNLNFKDV